MLSSEAEVISKGFLNNKFNLSNIDIGKYVLG
jgi:hypothetical protein